MIHWLRHFLLRTTRPVLEWISQHPLPCVRRKMTGVDYFDIVKRLKGGMVLLSRNNCELTNIFIGHDWTHAAMYIGKFGGVDYVIEATTHGVKETDLVSFITSKDRICILIPLFGNEMTMRVAAETAMIQKDKPYDWDFEREVGSNQKAFYCSELIWYAYDDACLKTLGIQSPFEPRETWGVKTITPQDIYDAKNKWRIIFEK